MTRGRQRGHRVWSATGRRITDATGTYEAQEEARKSDASQKRWRVILGPQNVQIVLSPGELFDLEDLLGRVGDYVEGEEESAAS